RQAKYHSKTGFSMLITLSKISKSYGRIEALRDLTAQVPEGAIGLLGPNGAGKTTLIRTLLGLIAIDRGSGSVLGHDIRREAMAIRRSVGFMPEEECLFPAMAGVEFVAYAGRLGGMRRTDAMQRAHEVLDYVGLGEARYRQVESYSTGMKQRLKLAGAIVHDPKLVILDEPTNGMDPAGRVEILELARDLTRNKGLSLLFSSPLLPDVEEGCHHGIVLGRGRLWAQGCINELKAQQQGVYEVRVKTQGDDFARQLTASGCRTEPTDDCLLVHLPAGSDSRLVWQTASELGHQVRWLKPRRSSL